MQRWTDCFTRDLRRTRRRRDSAGAGCQGCPGQLPVLGRLGRAASGIVQVREAPVEPPHVVVGLRPATADAGEGAKIERLGGDVVASLRLHPRQVARRERGQRVIVARVAA